MDPNSRQYASFVRDTLVNKEDGHWIPKIFQSEKDLQYVIDKLLECGHVRDILAKKYGSFPSSVKWAPICDNPRCCRPQHLEPTYKSVSNPEVVAQIIDEYDNQGYTITMIAAKYLIGRNMIRKILNGTYYGLKSKYTGKERMGKSVPKMNIDKAIEAKRLLAEGKPKSELCARYGVSHTTLQKWIDRAPDQEIIRPMGIPEDEEIKNRVWERKKGGF